MSDIPWQQLSAAERAREYSPSSCIGGNYQPFVEAYRARSAEAHAAALALGARWIERHYGTAPSQRLDLYLPPAMQRGAAPCPLLVFIHGGYWQELSARDSRFAAARCVERGIAFAAVDYTLAPAARVPQIVDECRAAFVDLARAAPGLGIDPALVVVAGSSAGAHLAAMIGVEGALPGGVAPPHALVLVSGIYLLEPLIGTPIDDALGLQAGEARVLSPLRLPLRGFPRSAVCWGEVETAQFKAQSRAFDDALRAAGAATQRFEVPGRNHFDVILDLAEPGTTLGNATLQLFDNRA